MEVDSCDHWQAVLFLQMDLVVATPKRLSHLVKAKQIDMSSVQFLILDEADKLFELGFVSHIDAIIHACSNPNIVSSHGQTLSVACMLGLKLHAHCSQCVVAYESNQMCCSASACSAVHEYTQTGSQAWNPFGMCSVDTFAIAYDGLGDCAQFEQQQMAHHKHWTLLCHFAFVG